jgi:hypothetical protein
VVQAHALDDREELVEVVIMPSVKRRYPSPSSTRKRPSGSTSRMRSSTAVGSNVSTCARTQPSGDPGSRRMVIAPFAVTT